ncbi:MAG: PD40 domain-containing protein [Solirubrobacteraceae bacterium]|nr:PD40 domain-containing protein [Solirubrobacteraceae bacterium]
MINASRHRSLRQSLSHAALAVCAAALAAAPAAQADSISYVKNGDVWVTAPDGSRTVQVTHDGGYSYASRADDGSFIALHGRRLHRLSVTGALLADFDTPVSGEQTAPNTSFFRGPYKPEISPDGTKVAYEYWHQAFLSDPGCQPVGTPLCTDKRVSTGIGYSYSDRQTLWDEPGLGRQSGWVDPSWIDNTTLLQSYKSVRPNVDAIIDHPGDGNGTIQTWFEDTEAWYLKDGEISRRGDAAAFVSAKPRAASDPLIGQEDDQVTVYRMHGAAPALPEQCFSFHNPEVKYASPTFSPDGTHLAFTAEHRTTHEVSLFVAELPSQQGGCASPSAGGVVLTTGAVAPDWSPADVPAMPAAATGRPGTSGGSGTPQSSQSQVVRSPQIGAGKGARRTIAAGQLPLVVTLPAAGRVQLTVLRGSRKLAQRTTTVKAAGTTKVRVPIGKAARRALRGRTTVTVRYRFTPAGGTVVRGRVDIKLG